VCLVLGIASFALFIAATVVWIAGPTWFSGPRANAAYGVFLFAVPLLAAGGAVLASKKGRKLEVGAGIGVARGDENDSVMKDRRGAWGIGMVVLTYALDTIPLCVLVVAFILGGWSDGGGY
jgi:hypothetical protein